MKRLSLREAIQLAQERGIRVQRKWDGHWHFYTPNKVWSVNNGRKDTIVPPGLAKAIEKGAQQP